MANSDLNDYDYILQSYYTYIKEVEQSGIPLWVSHSYYSYSVPRLNGDMANQFNESHDDLFSDDDDTLGL